MACIARRVPHVQRGAGQEPDYGDEAPDPQAAPQGGREKPEMDQPSARSGAERSPPSGARRRTTFSASPSFCYQGRSGLDRSPSDLRNYPAQAVRQPAPCRAHQMRDAASGLVLGVRVGDEEPVISRPSPAATTAARASCSAVAAPAETPMTVASARVVSGILGVRLSTTATTMTSPGSGCRRRPLRRRSPGVGRFVDAAGSRLARGAERGRVLVSCCGPTTSAVGMPCEAAKTASWGPRARALASEDRDSTVARSSVLPLYPGGRGRPAQLLQGRAQLPGVHRGRPVALQELGPSGSGRGMADRDRREDRNPDRTCDLVALPEPPVVAAEHEGHDDPDQGAGQAPIRP